MNHHSFQHCMLDIYQSATSHSPHGDAPYKPLLPLCTHSEGHEWVLMRLLVTWVQPLLACPQAHASDSR